MAATEICEVGVMLILLNGVLKCCKRTVFLKHGNFIEVFLRMQSIMLMYDIYSVWFDGDGTRNLKFGMEM